MSEIRNTQTTMRCTQDHFDKIFHPEWFKDGVRIIEKENKERAKWTQSLKDVGDVKDIKDDRQ